MLRFDIVKKILGTNLSSGEFYEPKKEGLLCFISQKTIKSIHSNPLCYWNVYKNIVAHW